MSDIVVSFETKSSDDRLGVPILAGEVQWAEAGAVHSMTRRKRGPLGHGRSQRQHQRVNIHSSPLVLDQFLPYRLAVLSSSVSRALSEVYGARFDLTIAEWRIMANLGHARSLYAGELAERSSMDKPKVTRALQRMETSGLILRSTDADDRRQARLSLTPKGQQMFRGVAAIALEWEHRLLAPLSAAERTTFEVCLQKLHASVGDLRSSNEFGIDRIIKKESKDEAL